ncbi:uncharacterized protein BDR25DRAFT_394099 [Lindgomyces ingoldianus]|uniref:Uncharacterized protein n=1 Tax=Lindgomyces ingoldianus TaxID=673940 RepID=A0ACB6QT37_9PLEO|nr:uncharacterized protein BDR25DRAFT_394099 [Lindgomyces ingoldianus]KAF2470194.1 hypothetical protein BDR25DRAFT_394099 [Lindgomyces ingoldianus]
MTVVNSEKSKIRDETPSTQFSHHMETVPRVRILAQILHFKQKEQHLRPISSKERAVYYAQIIVEAKALYSSLQEYAFDALKRPKGRAYTSDPHIAQLNLLRENLDQETRGRMVMVAYLSLDCERWVVVLVRGGSSLRSARSIFPRLLISTLRPYEGILCIIAGISLAYRLACTTLAAYVFAKRRRYSQRTYYNFSPNAEHNWENVKRMKVTPAMFPFWLFQYLQDGSKTPPNPFLPLNSTLAAFDTKNSYKTSSSPKS